MNLNMKFALELILIFISLFLINIIFQFLIYNELIFKDSSYLLGFSNNQRIGFWNSSLGVSSHMLINVICNSFSIFCTLILYKIKNIDYHKILQLVYRCNLIFIIEMFFEYRNISANKELMFKDVGISIFSLKSKLNELDISIPPYLTYVTETINIFEFLYISCLFFYLKSFLNIDYLKSTMIIFFSYIIPMIFWLSIITLLSI